MSNIFISYRREDSAAHAGRLSDALKQRFGDEAVFMDIYSLLGGVDFRRRVKELLSSCDALVAVIGKKWLEASDTEGRRRLDDPEDLVRVEIGTALDRGIHVIPILVGGASMPRRADLPEPLVQLADRNTVTMTEERWSHDIDRLLQSLESLIDAEAEEDDDNEEGFFDLIEKGRERFQTLSEVGKRINEFVRDLGLNLQSRSQEMVRWEAGSGTSKTQHIKHVSDLIAEDLEHFCSGMEKEIPVFAECYIQGLESFARSGLLLTDLEADYQEAIRDAVAIIQSLRSDDENLMTAVSNYMKIIQGYPKYTSRLSRARKRTLRILKKLKQERAKAVKLSLKAESELLEKVTTIPSVGPRVVLDWHGSFERGAKVSEPRIRNRGQEDAMHVRVSGLDAIGDFGWRTEELDLLAAEESLELRIRGGAIDELSLLICNVIDGYVKPPEQQATRPVRFPITIAYDSPTGRHYHTQQRFVVDHDARTFRMETLKAGLPGKPPIRSS